MSTKSILKDFVLNDYDGYVRLMKDLDEAEKRPRKSYDKPAALIEGEQRLREFLYR